MNGIILGGIEYVAAKVIGFLVWVFASVANSINVLALAQTHLPWVVTAKDSVEAVAWTVLGVYVAYVALTRYILWNEGTADPDGTNLYTGILRAVIYVALSGFLATAVFQWGLDLAQVLAASPMITAAQSANGLLNQFANAGTISMGFILGMVVTIGLGVVLMIVAAFQMAIRAAELVVYIIAAPLVSLGQLNADGGTWSAWWANLIILSFSQVITLLSFKGLAGTTQLMTQIRTAHGFNVAMAGMTVFDTPLGLSTQEAIGATMALLTVLMMIGWMVVAIKGPHLLRQWSYRTGVGGFGVWVGGNMLRNPLGNAGSRVTDFLSRWG